MNKIILSLLLICLTGVGHAADGDSSVKADTDKDGAGEELHVDKAMIGILDNLQKIFGEANSGNTKALSTGHEEIVKFTQQYLESKPSCVKFHEGAAYACLEFLSPHMIDGAAALNSVAALGGVAVKDSCSKFSSAMDIASKALTAYTAACGAAKLGCGGSCGSALEGIEGLIKTASKAKLNCIPTAPPLSPDYPAAHAKCDQLNIRYAKSITSLKEQAANENNKKDKISVAGKTGLCTEKYAQLAISAVAGIGALAKSMMQGNDCEKKTNGDSGVPSLNSKLNADLCNDVKNAKLPECICKANPRTPGCANSFQKAGDGSLNQLSTGIGDRANANPADRNLAGLDTDSGLPSIDHRDVNTAGGAAGAPTGGGNAGLGGGGGSGSGSGAGADDSGSGGIDLEKYGGGFSGGGGGAGRFGGGGGSGSSKYRSYLPGGARDPNRGIAGQEAWAKEVTGQGGKSNWEKVKDRYRDNKSTLLNN